VHGNPRIIVVAVLHQAQRDALASDHQLQRSQGIIQMEHRAITAGVIVLIIADADVWVRHRLAEVQKLYA